MSCLSLKIHYYGYAVGIICQCNRRKMNRLLHVLLEFLSVQSEKYKVEYSRHHIPGLASEFPEEKQFEAAFSDDVLLKYGGIILPRYAHIFIRSPLCHG